MSTLGNRVVRREDPKLLTVGGTYVDDLRDERLAGAAHITFVRSTMALSTPAAQSAVVDALAHLGIRHIDLPATPQRVWPALQAAS